MFGTHQLVFRTEAECNSNYLKAIGYDPVELRVATNDTCLYTTYKTILFVHDRKAQV
jgi:hypothetical protein